MHRRDIGLALLGSVVLAFAPYPVRAQTRGKVYRIGYLSTPTRSSVQRGVEAFVSKLRELGWVEGRNLKIEYRWAEGDVGRLPALAAELAREKVDLIVAPAGSAALAAKNATGSIPIVMIFPSDPVEMGLVASLSHPGANVTGTTFTSGPEIYGKQLQILKEALPRASRVAVLWNPIDQSFATQATMVEAAAQSLNVRLQRVEARGPQNFDEAFAAMARERAEALLISGTSTFLAHGPELVHRAATAHLPTMCAFREMVHAGGLMAYGVNMAEFVSHAAVYVDRILKGAKPSELPVEQPDRFELVINLKTAGALRVTIPAPLLLRADEVIR